MFANDLVLVAVASLWEVLVVGVRAVCCVSAFERPRNTGFVDISAVLLVIDAVQYLVDVTERLGNVGIQVSIERARKQAVAS